MITRRIDYLYKKGGNSERNPQEFIVLFDPKSWPQRILDRRGYSSMTRIHTREMTDSEFEHYQKTSRCQAYRYQKLEHLLEDELKILSNDDPLIKILLDLQSKINKQ